MNRFLIITLANLSALLTLFFLLCDRVDVQHLSVCSLCEKNHAYDGPSLQLQMFASSFTARLSFQCCVV